MVDMVKPLLAAGTPVGQAVTWWPDNTPDLITQGIPLVRARKVPGITELDGKLVVSNVLLSARTGSRGESWNVLTYLADELYRIYRRGPTIVSRSDGSKSQVMRLEVEAADQQLPELDPDHRVVSNVITLTLRRTA
jgi:hypothetical protein